MSEQKLNPAAYPNPQMEVVDGSGRHIKWLPYRSNAVWVKTEPNKAQPDQQSNEAHHDR